MKKSLALVLAGTMAFGLTACGGGKTSTPSTTAAAAATEAAAVSEAATEAAKAETADLNVGVFYYTYSDTYIASVRTALDKAMLVSLIRIMMATATRLHRMSRSIPQSARAQTC